MNHRRLLGVAVAACAVAGSARTSYAQIVVETEVALQTSYIWRGLNLATGPALQPTAIASYGVGRADLSIGAFSNVALGGIDAGTGAWRVTEYQSWAELATNLGRLTFGTGVAWTVTQLIDAPAALTTELYITTGLDASITPTVTAGYDLAVAGAFVELALARTLVLPRDWTLTLSAASGLSLGQSDADEYFAGDGITHVDVGAALSARVGSVEVRPALSWVIGVDQAVRDASGRAGRVWGGVTCALPTAELMR